MDPFKTNNEQIKTVATRCIKEQIETTNRNLERVNAEIIGLKKDLETKEETAKVFINDIVILKATYHRIVNDIDTGKLGDLEEQRHDGIPLDPHRKFAE